MKSAFRDDYVTTQEAADILGYTVQHARLLFREGRLRAAKFGRDWLVPRRDLAQYLARQPRDVRYRSVAQQAEEARPDAIVADALPGFPEDLVLARGDAAAVGVNVAQVPQRSPFRYPGGKTWLVPYVRQWLKSVRPPVTDLIEPFAGGGIVSLTAVFEGLAKRATMVELDEEVASVWHTILNGDAQWLANRIARFRPSRESVKRVVGEQRASLEHKAFATIVRNRVTRGGILAPGAGLVKLGENGRGLLSRWYPRTLRRRILAIAAFRDRIHFIEGDGMAALRAYERQPECVFFIDPPYTVTGRRLYKYSSIAHEELFARASLLRGDFLMTYDNAAEIRALAARHGFATRLITMKTTHHAAKQELLVGRDMDWLGK